jgi:hypothetical protein
MIAIIFPILDLATAQEHVIHLDLEWRLLEFGAHGSSREPFHDRFGFSVFFWWKRAFVLQMM